jgi:hypothetical protein
MHPRFAAIRRPIDAVSHGKIGPMQTFARTDVDDLGVRLRDRDGTDRLRGLGIEDRVPGAAIVIGLPHAAVDRSDQERIRPAGNAGYGPSAAAAKRAHHPPRKILRDHRNRRIGGVAHRDGEQPQQRSETTGSSKSHREPLVFFLTHAARACAQG